jgi:hypothetical protein
MGWVCVGCGERHLDSFETCWKCGGLRAEGTTGPDPDNNESDVPALSSDELVRERDALDRRAAPFARLRRGWALRLVLACLCTHIGYVCTLYGCERIYHEYDCFA